MWWELMMVCGMMICGSHSVLINLSKKNGQIPYNPASVVLLVELGKMLFSIIMLIPEAMKRNLKFPSLLPSLAFCVPAFLYCINNNLVYYCQLKLDPASFQVLSNLKIVTTAILYRLIINRKILPQQWTAICFLTLAGFSNGYGGIYSSPTHDSLVDGRHDVTKQIYVTFTGVLLVLVYCVFSGLAGVYTEFILKKNQSTSLHQQNIMLYFYGLMFNIWAYHGGSGQNSSISFFDGFTVWTVIIVVTQAMNGLIMSAIMKHASNITRIVLVSSALVVTTILSVLIFDMKLNIFFDVSVILVIIALVIYHRR